jgi:hypothetical protein
MRLETSWKQEVSGNIQLKEVEIMSVLCKREMPRRELLPPPLTNTYNLLRYGESHENWEKDGRPRVWTHPVSIPDGDLTINVYVDIAYGKMRAFVVDKAGKIVDQGESHFDCLPLNNYVVLGENLGFPEPYVYKRLKVEVEGCQSSTSSSS